MIVSRTLRMTRLVNMWIAAAVNPRSPDHHQGWRRMLSFPS